MNLENCIHFRTQVAAEHGDTPAPLFVTPFLLTAPAVVSSPKAVGARIRDRKG